MLFPLFSSTSSAAWGIAEQSAKIGRLKDQGITTEAEKTIRLLEECLANFENQLQLLWLEMALSSLIAGFIF